MSLLLKILFAVLVLTPKTYAEELVTVRFDGVSQATSPADAVKEVSQQATSTTARDQVVDLIGEAKYRKHKQLVDSKILTQSSKFIPYINPSQAQPTSNGYKVSVELRVSTESLRNIVEKAGLLADTDSPGTLVSLVSFTDKSTDLTYRWWAPESVESKRTLVTLNSLWQQSITSELEKRKFNIVKVAKQTFDESELMRAAQAQMALRGEARIRTLEDGSGTISMKVGVYQAADSRLIADSIKTAKFSKFSEASIKAAASPLFAAISKELSASVYEAWQKGMVGASSLKIAAIGSLTPKQFEELKSELSRTLRDLKNLRERKFAAGRVVLEGDYKGNLSNLSDRLKQIQLPNFQTEVAGFEGDQIALRVKPRR